MSTDRELLQLAAKAAGYEPVRLSMVSDGPAGLMLRGVQEPWNPLTDDCDALRLAVKCGLEVRQVHAKAHAGMIGMFWFTESYGSNPYAATRRAITRAAASLAAAEEQKPCAGVNCGTTTRRHSPECIAEHARACALRVKG